MSGLSREDQARVEWQIEKLRHDAKQPGIREVQQQLWKDAEILTRALTLLDQYEKALEAADELARVAGMESVYMAPNGNGAEAVRRITKAEAAYRSARSTSTKEDG